MRLSSGATRTPSLWIDRRCAFEARSGECLRPGQKLLFYAVLATPSALLLGLVAMAALAIRVTQVIQAPDRFDAAPVVVQKFAKAVYWRHRTHWHTVRSCVQYDETVLYKPKPGRCAFRNTEFANTFHFDDLTLRVTAPAAAQATDAPRLLVLGDSHTLGWGVEDHETYASVLATAHGLPTLNLGVSSYGTARELMRLRALNVLRPQDAILIQYCENDRAENVSFMEQGAARRAPEDFEKLLAHRPAEVTVVNVAATLVQILADDVVKNVNAALQQRGGNDRSDAQVFVNVLDRFPELRGRTIYVTEVNGFGYRSSFLDDIERLDRPELRVIRTDLGVADFYRLDDHLTPAGQAKLARQIAAALLSQTE